MKNKPYVVRGDKKKGFRIAVPTETGVKKGDRYTFIANPYDRNGAICLPPGSLVYVPVVKK
jgi:hypothetical protein